MFFSLDAVNVDVSGWRDGRGGRETPLRSVDNPSRSVAPHAEHTGEAWRTGPHLVSALGSSSGEGLIFSGMFGKQRFRRNI